MSDFTVAKSPYTFGVDLGTSNSAIAVSANDRVAILDIEGKKTMPSVVTLRSDGDIIVGNQARNRAIIEPDNTIISIKREMGNPTWTKEVNGVTYAPEDISEKILSKLIEQAERNAPFDLVGTPSKVVLCIPANFSDLQRKASIQAAELAGLNVVTLIEEPVAAAIAYALEKDRDQTILVYDLGGGTFDVSILDVKSKIGAPADLRILAKEGVPVLGGDDFDRKIIELLASRLQETSGIDVLDLRKDSGVSERHLREVQQRLKDAAIQAKHELAESESTHISLLDVLKDEGGKAHSVEVELTRDDFNGMIRAYIDETIACVAKAIESASLTKDQISRIILVGGSTRVPLVRIALTDFFGKEPYSDLDPDTVVAYGAAMYGARLDSAEERVVVHEKVTHFLGIETFGGKCSWLIEKNTDIPASEPLSESKEFTTGRDNQTEIAIRVYQSDEPVEFSNDEKATFIGEFFLMNLPELPKGQVTVDVRFEIDQQNLLRVSATSADQSEQIEVKRA